MNRLFPAVLMCLYTASSITYFVSGDWRRALYWACALGLTISITF